MLFSTLNTFFRRLALNDCKRGEWFDRIIMDEMSGFEFERRIRRCV